MEAKKTYSELLKDPRWQKKRLEVLYRDDWKCVECGDDKQTLHVHHQYYKADTDPWDYPQGCYITVCEKCHELKHRVVKITENGGVINPSDFIDKFPIETQICFAEIGNHEGSWTIKLNKDISILSALPVLSLLAGYAYFDNDIEVVGYGRIKNYSSSKKYYDTMNFCDLVNDIYKNHEIGYKANPYVQDNDL